MNFEKFVEENNLGHELEIQDDHCTSVWVKVVFKQKVTTLFLGNVKIDGTWYAKRAGMFNGDKFITLSTIGEKSKIVCALRLKLFKKYPPMICQIGTHNKYRKKGLALHLRLHVLDNYGKISTDMRMTTSSLKFWIDM